MMMLTTLSGNLDCHARHRLADDGVAALLGTTSAALILMLPP